MATSQEIEAARKILSGCSAKMTEASDVKMGSKREEDLFLSGKSIEETKKDAAIEKSKQLAELPYVAGLKNDALSKRDLAYA